MRVRTSACQTERVTVESEPSLLYREMEKRRKAPFIGLRMTALANDRTIARIRRGEILTESTRLATVNRGRAVYEQIDDLLHWMPGDAERCARENIPPRPLSTSYMPLPANMVTNVEVAAVLSRASAALLTADKPDDVDQEIIKEAVRRTSEWLDDQQGRRTSDGGSGSNGGQRSS